MLSSDHNQACVDRYAETGVLESERVSRQVRGTCECGGNIYSDCVYRPGRGYELVWTCDRCDYRLKI